MNHKIFSSILQSFSASWLLIVIHVSNKYGFTTWSSVYEVASIVAWEMVVNLECQSQYESHE